MMLYEFLDIIEAQTIIVCNEPFNKTFFLLEIENGNTNDVNSLVYDAVESCDVHRMVVENDTLYIYLDEDHINVDVDWDENGTIDFYDLEKGTDPEGQELARSLGIYIM